MYSITKKRALTSKREMLLTFSREFSGTVAVRALYVAMTMSR